MMKAGVVNPANLTTVRCDELEQFKLDHAELIEENESLREELREMIDLCTQVREKAEAKFDQSNRVRKKLYKVTMDYKAQNKVLMDALIRLRDCDWIITLPDRMDAVRDIAKQALKEVE